ncbi:MAG: hypothetical protein JW862_17990 [Anaerolineales bacterium]|nr:hypothetical protein [Anaerolineales bacterium]
MKTRYLPDPDQLSAFAAVIILAYSLASIIELPEQALTLQIPGVYFEININMASVIGLLVAGLTASGAAWIIRSHPRQQHRITIEHWLLPALTAWAIGIPLLQGNLGLFWIVGVFLGGGVLLVVLIAEYTVVEPDDQFYTLSSITLTAISYALFLIIAIGLRTAELRLFLLLPALTFANALVNLRVFHLRLRGKWAWQLTGVSVLINAQLITALHYLPLSPIQFGLFLLGPAYALTILLGAHAEGTPWQKSITEPIAVLILLTAFAWWLR